MFFHISRKILGRGNAGSSMLWVQSRVVYAYNPQALPLLIYGLAMRKSLSGLKTPVVPAPPPPKKEGEFKKACCRLGFLVIRCCVATCLFFILVASSISLPLERVLSLLVVSLRVLSLIFRSLDMASLCLHCRCSILKSLSALMFYMNGIALLGHRMDTFDEMTA